MDKFFVSANLIGDDTEEVKLKTIKKLEKNEI